MSAFHALVGVCLGIALGLVLLVAGGLQSPAPARCPHCAVLTHPLHDCNEAVDGGFICP